MSEASRRPARKPLHLGVANFKAFGPHPQNIPLKPITLVFGPNSGGKSSLLHYLLWLKDVVCPPHGRKHPLDVYWPSAGDANVELNGSRQGVDLGGFKQFRHGSDASAEVENRLCLRLRGSLDVEIISRFATCPPPANYHARLRAMVKERLDKALQSKPLQDLLEWGIELAKKLTKDSLTQMISAEYGESRLKLWLEAALDENDYPYANIENLQAPDFSEVFEKECPKLSQAAQEYGPLKDLGLAVRDESPSYGKPPSAEEVIVELQNLVCRMFDELKHKPLPAAEAERPSLVRFEIRSGENTLLLAERNEVSELELLKLDLGTHAPLLGGSRDQDAAHFRFERDSAGFRVVFDDATSWLPGSPRLLESAATEAQTSDANILKLLGRRDSDSMMPEVDLLRLCQGAAEAQFGSLSYLGPIRAYPSRDIKVAELPEGKDSHGWFAWRRLGLSGTLREQVNEWLATQNSCLQITVGHQAVQEQYGQGLRTHLLERIDRWKADILNKENLEGTTTGHDGAGWDAESDLDEAIKVSESAFRTDKSKTVFLKDAKTGKAVSCRDIGVGISQLVPVLVQAMDSQKEIIVMEQPELHLHPRLQAELGDLFIESALGRGNTFVLETHSEHLILRVLRRIRETTRNKLPDGVCPINPQDVAVLYVQPSEHGSAIQELRIDEHGRFRDNWPQGFFEDRLDEMF